MLNIDERIHRVFRGEYKKLVSTLLDNSWMAIAYVVLSIVAAYSLSYVQQPAILFILTGLPVFFICLYVTSPDKSILARLPFNWILAASLAGLLYVYSRQSMPGTAVQNAIGIICWFFVGYWITNAILWSWKVRSAYRWKVRSAYRGSSIFMNTPGYELFGFIISTWGATLQVAFFVSWLLLPVIDTGDIDGWVLVSFFESLEWLTSLSLFKVLPLGLFLLGILMYVALGFKKRPYHPKSLDEVLAGEARPPLSLLITTIRIPVWILVVIIGFISHFSMLLLLAVFEFAQFWLARFAFILVGLVLAPAVLFVGHYIHFYLLEKVVEYNQTIGISLGHVLDFLLLNALILLILCTYIVSIPLMAVRYRGEALSDFLHELYDDVVLRGKEPANAVGRAFSLVGVLVFAVPVAALLPGGSDFGMVSILYSVLIVGYLLYHLIFED